MQLNKLYIHNVTKAEVNLYDIGVRLRPGQYFELLAKIDIDLINKSMRSGAIKKNRLLQKVVFAKSVPVKSDMLQIQVSDIPKPSTCKVPKLARKSEFEELLDENESLAFDDYAHINRPGSSNGKT